MAWYDLKKRNDLFSFLSRILIKHLGHGPPNDRIKRIERDQRISILTYSIMATISGTGILLAIAFFVFNIVFRKHRLAQFYFMLFFFD